MKKENQESTDGVAETNLMVLGDATAMGMGNTTIVNAHSISLLFEQQITKQKNDYATGLSNTVKSINQMLGKPQPLKDRILAASSRYTNLLNEL